MGTRSVIFEQITINIRIEGIHVVGKWLLYFKHKHENNSYFKIHIVIELLHTNLKYFTVFIGKAIPILMFIGRGEGDEYGKGLQ